MTKKEEILQMYFGDHKKQESIAELVGVSQSYISQVIQKDSRYTKEKETRHKESMQKKAEYNKEYNKTYIRKRKNNVIEEYYALLELLKKDNKFLSTKYEMLDIAFAKWNRSIYQYDKNSSNLVLKRGINVTKDVPRVVRNVVKASSIKSSNVYAR
ncbi:MAG: hypothetical protein ACLS9A_04335 [Clostridia bacterium]|jgi:hypothetical protein